MDKITARVLLFIGIMIILIIVFLHGVGYARPYSTDEYDDSPYKWWYKELRQPKALFNPDLIAQDPKIYPSFCCDVSECHATEDDIRGGHYYARVGIRERNFDGELNWTLMHYVLIPDVLVAHPEENVPNPTGHAVICHQTFEVDEKGLVYTDDGEGDKTYIKPEEVYIYCFFPSSLL